jgi:RNA polymerase sigma-70 factor (ECF subfamily)
LKPGDPASRSYPASSAPAGGSEAAAERQWVERARAGDTAAFRELVERHRDRAFGLALRILRSRADAEEVAQDAFVRAWRALPRFRGDARFGTWLYRIVARKAFDRAAALKGRRGRETRLEDVGDLAESAGQSPPPGDQERKLESLMGRLSEAQRAAVTLFYYEDRSVQEVARILAMPENTVKTHLSRARAALREAWRREER